MPLVWTMPDGSVRVTQIVDAVVERERRPGEATADVVTRLAAKIQAKTPDVQGGVATLVRTADMPADRTQRRKWRLVDGKVVVDAAVIIPMSARQTLIDDIAKATTVADLKPLLLKVMGA